MGVAERFAATPAKVTPCKLGRVLAALDVKARAVVLAAIDGPRPTVNGGEGWSDQAIAHGLSAEGHPVSDSTVRDHRNKICRCPR